MADSDLLGITDHGSLDGTEVLYIVQGGNSRRVTLAELATYIKTAESIVPTNLPWRGCRVSRTADQTGITWPVIVTWNTADIDTDGIWSVGDPTKLVVPAGVTKVKLVAAAALELGSIAGSMVLSIRKNKTGTGGESDIPFTATSVRNTTGGYTSNTFAMETGTLEVVAGDYFDLRINCNMAGIDTLLASNQTWFEMEIVEAGVTP